MNIHGKHQRITPMKNWVSPRINKQSRSTHIPTDVFRVSNKKMCWTNIGTAVFNSEARTSLRRTEDSLWSRLSFCNNNSRTPKLKWERDFSYRNIGKIWEWLLNRCRTKSAKSPSVHQKDIGSYQRTCKLHTWKAMESPMYNKVTMIGVRNSFTKTPTRPAYKKIQN